MGYNSIKTSNCGNIRSASHNKVLKWNRERLLQYLIGRSVKKTLDYWKVWKHGTYYLSVERDGLQ